MIKEWLHVLITLLAYLYNIHFDATQFFWLVSFHNYFFQTKKKMHHYMDFDVRHPVYWIINNVACYM